MHLPDESGSVKLAKLIVELAREDGTFFLSVRKPCELVGLSHAQVSRLLKHWHRTGVLDIMVPGRPGHPGSRATRYRLNPKRVVPN
ncbi:hypothetical protein Q31b_49330 [Novipirellula aureliae]|uniref:Helix-turn-helix domain-containing protein n=1 Tax=Novipirellula aureliae TaxID=2527966 RepID=A0A5C6DJ83_9BACT|nr:hypothetical protein Q31b_49330 [Novipirellula aureliae]